MTTGTPLWVDFTDPEETWATFYTDNGCEKERVIESNTYLGIGVVQIILRVRVIQVLLEHNVVFRSVPADDEGFDTEPPLGIYGDVDIGRVHAVIGLRVRVWLDVVGNHLTRRAFPRGVCDDLE